MSHRQAYYQSVLIDDLNGAIEKAVTVIGI
jgi:hypothetical protein